MLKTSIKKATAFIEILRVMKADVYRSWCLSNSSLRICSALNALIVVSPSNEELIWPTRGLRAVIETNYSSIVKKLIHYVKFNLLYDKNCSTRIVSNLINISKIQMDIAKN